MVLKFCMIFILLFFASLAKIGHAQQFLEHLSIHKVRHHLENLNISQLLRRLTESDVVDDGDDDIDLSGDLSQVMMLKHKETLNIRIFNTRNGSVICEGRLSNYVSEGRFHCVAAVKDLNLVIGPNKLIWAIYNTKTGKPTHKQYQVLHYFDSSILNGYYSDFYVEDASYSYAKRALIAGGASSVLGLLFDLFFRSLGNLPRPELPTGPNAAFPKDHGKGGGPSSGRTVSGHRTAWWWGGSRTIGRSTGTGTVEGHSTDDRQKARRPSPPSLLQSKKTAAPQKAPLSSKSTPKSQSSITNNNRDKHIKQRSIRKAANPVPVQSKAVGNPRMNGFLSTLASVSTSLSSTASKLPPAIVNGGRIATSAVRHSVSSAANGLSAAANRTTSTVGPFLSSACDTMTCASENIISASCESIRRAGSGIRSAACTVSPRVASGISTISTTAASTISTTAVSVATAVDKIVSPTLVDAAHNIGVASIAVRNGTVFVATSIHSALLTFSDFLVEGGHQAYSKFYDCLLRCSSTVCTRLQRLRLVLIAAPGVVREFMKKLGGVIREIVSKARGALRKCVSKGSGAMHNFVSKARARLLAWAVHTQVRRVVAVLVAVAFLPSWRILLPRKKSVSTTTQPSPTALLVDNFRAAATNLREQFHRRPQQTELQSRRKTAIVKKPFVQVKAVSKSRDLLQPSSRPKLDLKSTRTVSATTTKSAGSRYIAKPKRPAPAASTVSKPKASSPKNAPSGFRNMLHFDFGHHDAAQSGGGSIFVIPSTAVSSPFSPRSTSSVPSMPVFILQPNNDKKGTSPPRSSSREKSAIGKSTSSARKGKDSNSKSAAKGEGAIVTTFPSIAALQQSGASLAAKVGGPFKSCGDGAVFVTSTLGDLRDDFTGSVSDAVLKVSQSIVSYLENIISGKNAPDYAKTDGQKQSKVAFASSIGLPSSNSRMVGRFSPSKSVSGQKSLYPSNGLVRFSLQASTIASDTTAALARGALSVLQLLLSALSGAAASLRNAFNRRLDEYLEDAPTLEVARCYLRQYDIPLGVEDPWKKKKQTLSNGRADPRGD